jgi:hypothetical protein
LLVCSADDEDFNADEEAEGEEEEEEEEAGARHAAFAAKTRLQLPLLEPCHLLHCRCRRR